MCVWILFLFLFVQTQVAFGEDAGDSKFVFDEDYLCGIPNPVPKACVARRCAYVTMVHDLNDMMLGMWKGALVWAKSLIETGTQLDIVVITVRDLPEMESEAIKKLGVKLRVFPEFAGIPPHMKPGGSWYHPWHKLNVWRLHEEYDIVFCQDSDLMVVQNMDHLFDTFPYSEDKVVYMATNFPCYGCEDTGLEDPDSRASTQFLTRTSLEIYMHMEQVAKTASSKNDQTFLNEYFSKQINDDNKSILDRGVAWLGSGIKLSSNPFLGCNNACNLAEEEILAIHFACIGPYKPWRLTLPLEEGYLKMRDSKFGCLEKNLRRWIKLYEDALAT